MIADLLPVVYELRNKSRETRRHLKRIWQEVLQYGVAPLGMRTSDDDGAREYHWLVVFREKMTDVQRDEHMRRHTPPGLRMRVF